MTRTPSGGTTRVGGRPGAVVWVTGIPGSGKSTLAEAIHDHIVSRGRPCELLDGSEVRESLSHDLGFSREDREENVRRIGYVAKLLSRNGVIAVCAAVSPYRATRDEVRNNTTNFIEVFVDCPVEVAEARDRSGRYARARAGTLPNFTGVDAPYEAPLAPEVHFHAERDAVDEGVWQVVRALQALEVIPVVGTSADAAAEESLRLRLRDLGPG